MSTAGHRDHVGGVDPVDRAGSDAAPLPRLAWLRDRRALIFDFDGVVADTEPVHAEAKRETLVQFQIAHPEAIFDQFKGRTDVDFFEHVIGHLDTRGVPFATLIEEKRRRYRELFVSVRLVPGFEALLTAARSSFERLAIATSATRADFELVADRFPLVRAVDAVVTSDDTAQFKPNPEPYLVALDRLGVRPGTAVAIEDSPNGVRSASDAGVLVVGLARAFSASDLTKAGARHIVNSLRTLADDVSWRDDKSEPGGTRG